WIWALAVLPTGLLATIGAAVLTGASAPSVVGDPGALVRWASPIVSMLTQVAYAVVLAGLVMLAFVLPAGRDDGGAWRWVRSLVSVVAPVWAVLTVAELVVGYALLAGRPLGGEGFGDELGF